MRIALLGYGKMGRMVESMAGARGFEIAAVVDPVAGSRGDPAQCDVCIDFTEPSAVLNNVRLAAGLGLPIVVGTTGWYDRMDEARSVIREAGTALVYGSNFSVGVNLMFELARQASALFSRFKEFDPFIEESHHRFKKDAPSGTAVFLERIMREAYGRQIPTFSVRAGYMPGSHSVGFDSEADTLTIVHIARNRSGFASGALLAAEWIRDRKGFFEFSDLMRQELRASLSDMDDRRD